MRHFEDFLTDRTQKDDEYYMEIALQAAQHARAKGDEPVGAVLVWSTSHLVEHNTINSEHDITNYAEMNVIRKASHFARKFDECTLYVTLEPNPMCALAASQAGIKEIIFGAINEDDGFISSEKAIDPIKYGIAFKSGVLEEDCMKLLPKPDKDE